MPMRAPGPNPCPSHLGVDALGLAAAKGVARIRARGVAVAAERAAAEHAAAVDVKLGHGAAEVDAHVAAAAAARLRHGGGRRERRPQRELGATGASARPDERGRLRPAVESTPRGRASEPAFASFFGRRERGGLGGRDLGVGGFGAVFGGKAAPGTGLIYAGRRRRGRCRPAARRPHRRRRQPAPRPRAVRPPSAAPSPAPHPCRPPPPPALPS
jgi:hypothetical protein